MNERIKELRLKLGLSQDEFGRRLGVTRGAITNIELNKVEPKPLFIDLMCREFHVNEIWLRTGEGEMFLPQDRSELIAQEVNRFMAEHPDSFRQRFISLLVRLDDKQWETLADYARLLVDAHDAFISSSPNTPDRNPTIEERVEAYRQELLAEEKGADESSPSPPDAKNA